MNDYPTRQRAYAGYYATMDEEGQLIEGRPAIKGPVTVRKPRLYTSPEAAEEAAQAMGTKAVRLV